jgi:hypothetical protein
VAALGHVVGGELPVLLGEVDAGQEAPALLLLGQVQEELDDDEPVVGEVALPVVDLLVAAAPDVGAPHLRGQLLALQELGVDPDHEDLLVVRPVEDADLPAGRQLPGVAPEEVVVEFLGRGCLEAVHVHALGVDPAHHVPDGPVLAAGVQGLQADQHAVGVLRGQAGLVLGQQPDAGLQEVETVGLLDEARLVAGVEVLAEVDRRPRLDPQGGDRVRDPPGSLVRHRRPPTVRPVP